MIKNKVGLKEFYTKLNNQFEGYIQMSDKPIKHIYIKPSSLPAWDDLHNKVNYILEMALFNSDTKQSILVRQYNENWLVMDKVITGKEHIQSYYTKDNLKMKIAQIWEPKKNEFCENWGVLEPTYLLFAGFKGGE